MHVTWLGDALEWLATLRRAPLERREDARDELALLVLARRGAGREWAAALVLMRPEPALNERALVQESLAQVRLGRGDRLERILRLGDHAQRLLLRQLRALVQLAAPLVADQLAHLLGQLEHPGIADLEVARARALHEPAHLPPEQLLGGEGGGGGRG